MTRFRTSHSGADTGIIPEEAVMQLVAVRPAADAHRLKHLIKAVEAKMGRIHEDNRFATFPTHLNLRWADLPIMLAALRAAAIPKVEQ